MKRGSPFLMGVYTCTTGGVNPATVDGSSPRTFSTEGFRKSVYAGFNWQLEHWLIGVEGDLGFGNKLRGTPGIPGCTTDCLGSPPTPDDIDSSSIKMLRDGSIRGRAGFFWSSQACSSTARRCGLPEGGGQLDLQLRGPVVLSARLLRHPKRYSQRDPERLDGWRGPRMDGS
jgi:hypothetical protein